MRLLFTYRHKWGAVLGMTILFSTCLACGRADAPGARGEDSTVNKKKDKVTPLPGVSEKLLPSEIQQGQVLIAYSDCYTCHAIDTKAKGPAFKDIAKRYPANEGYIELLAQKIIVGGSGVWGYPVMTPHPDVSIEHARLMVKYILSL